MKRLLILPLTLCSFFSLYAKDPSMKAAKKEAEKIASPLKEKLRSGEDLGFSDQDLLPDTDKGKEFDVIAAEKACKHLSQSTESDDLQTFLTSSGKREKIDENERFLVDGHLITQQPQSFIDIT